MLTKEAKMSTNACKCVTDNNRLSFSSKNYLLLV